MEQGRGSSQTNFRIYRLNSYLRAFSLGRSYLRPRVLIDFKLYKGWPTDGSIWRGCIGEAVAAGWDRKLLFEFCGLVLDDSDVLRTVILDEQK